MKYVARRDYSLSCEFAYDEDKKQPVIINYTCEKVVNDEIVYSFYFYTKVYSTFLCGINFVLIP